MKILITGASGPFGSAVARSLIETGIEAKNLILVSRNPILLQEFTANGADARVGDFDDYASLMKSFAGADKMLMISTNRVGQREPQHRNAVNAAKEVGVQHVIYTSFVSKPDNLSFAVKDHRFTEDLLRHSGLAWTFLRNSQYAEAMRDAGAPIAIRRGEWISSTGEGRIAMVTREDCIAAAAAVMGSDGHEGKIYDITGPELLTYEDLCRIVIEVSGRPIAYRRVDQEERYAFFDSIGIPRAAKDDNVMDGFGWCSDDMVSFEANLRAGNFAILSDDVEKLTGRKPETFRSFLMRYREQLQAIEPVQ